MDNTNPSQEPRVTERVTTSSESLNYLLQRETTVLAEADHKQTEQLARRLIGMAGLPRKFVGSSLLKMDTSLHQDTKRMVEMALRYLGEGICEYTEDIPDVLEPYCKGEGILPYMLALFGGYGTGKTAIATALVRGFALGGVPARYAYVPDLMNELRAGYTRKDEEEGGFYDLLDKLKNIEVLVLDDVGAVKATEWADEQVDSIVDYRYRECKRTIITSNMQITQLLPRMADRLREPTACTCIFSKAKSYRPSMKKAE